MMGFERSDDYQPLFWVRGPSRARDALLVILHTFGLITYCLMEGFARIDLWPLLNLFQRCRLMRHGQVWRVVTYAFVHQPSLWFLLDMAFLLFMWGREVERYFGRKTFIALYAALLVTAPVVLIIRSWLTGENQTLLLEGSTFVHMGVFIVFTTLYPNVQFFFGIACKWIAAGLVAITTLQCIAYHLVGTRALCSGPVSRWRFSARVMRASAARRSTSWATSASVFPRKTAPRGVKPRLKPRRAVDTPSYVGSARSGGSGGGNAGDRGDVHESIDPLLDKISKHGLASLTNGERATLERARVSLLRKDRGG